MVGGGIQVLVYTDEARMIGVAAGNRMIFELTELSRECDVNVLADLLVTKEQNLVSKQGFSDGAEQVLVGDRLGKVDSTELRTDVRGELLDPHQITKIEEPVVLPASRSLCASTASSSS